MISLFFMTLIAKIILAVPNPDLFNTNYKMALSLNDEFKIASSRSLLSMNTSVENHTKSTPVDMKRNSKETSDDSTEPDSMHYINPVVNTTSNHTAEILNSKEEVTESYEKNNFYFKRDSSQSMLVSMLNNKSEVWPRMKWNEDSTSESEKNNSSYEKTPTKNQVITVFQNASESTITSQAYLINSSLNADMKQNISQDKNGNLVVTDMVPVNNDNASLLNDSVLLEKYNASFLNENVSLLNDSATLETDYASFLNDNASLLNDSALLENTTVSVQNDFALIVNDSASVWQSQIKNGTSVINITYSDENNINDTAPFVNITVSVLDDTARFAENSDAPFGTKVPSTNCSKYLVPGSVTHEFKALLRRQNNLQVNIHQFQNKIRKYFSDDTDCSLVVTTITSAVVSWTDLHLNKSSLCVESRKQQLLQNITNELDVAPKFHKFFLPEFDIQYVNLSIYIECEHTESFPVVVARALDIIVYVLGSCLLFSAVTVVVVFLKAKAKKSHTVDTSTTPNTYQKYTLRSRRPVFMSPEAQRPVMLATCNPAYIDDETVEPKAKCFTET